MTGTKKKYDWMTKKGAELGKYLSTFFLPLSSSPAGGDAAGFVLNYKIWVTWSSEQTVCGGSDPSGRTGTASNS